ncbi:cupin domain-containing protein [Immundisolibacter sp.]|uniref:cupin domain-containing protein n=1 Tax=Immundisolibacter sp. TaxID=1934948 RepID=UPI003562E7F3
MRRIFLVLCLGVALGDSLVAAAEPAQVELYVPAGSEPRVMSLSEQNMREVVPGRLYMKHMVGPDMSVVLLNIKPGEPTPLNPGGQQHYQGEEATRAATISGGAMPPLHVHGQEVAILLKGEGKVVIRGGKEFPFKTGEAIIMPPGLPHTGIFTAPENLVLSITTPRRPEYGAHDQAER